MITFCIPQRIFIKGRRSGPFTRSFHAWRSICLIWVGVNLSRSCSRPLLISESDFGSEQIVPAAPVSVLLPSITYAFWHEKHSKLNHHSRSNRVSLLHWNTSDIDLSRFAGETPERSVTCIPTENRDKIWTRVQLCFYLFQMAKTICQWGVPGETIVDGAAC